MLSVNVCSPSVVALTADARRTTAIIGSRLSILPLSVWSKGISLRLRLGKREVLWRAESARTRTQQSSGGSDLIPFVLTLNNRVKTLVLYRETVLVRDRTPTNVCANLKRDLRFSS